MSDNDASKGVFEVRRVKSEPSMTDAEKAFLNVSNSVFDEYEGSKGIFELEPKWNSSNPMKDPRAPAEQPQSDPGNIIWNPKKVKKEQRQNPVKSGSQLRENQSGTPVKPTTLSDPLLIGKESMARCNLRDRIKTFVSRPIREKDLKKAEARAEAKKKSELKIKSKPPNDDFYPREDTDPFRVEDLFKFRRRDQEGRSYKPAKNLKIPDILPSSGLPTVKNNKNNNGQLFMDGFRPFWQEKQKPEKDDMDPETEEDLPANAAVVLDVCQGRIILQPMPTQPVEINPLKEVEDMKTLDQTFYTRDIVFGNTIRNITVNNEESSRRSHKKNLNFKSQESVAVVAEPKTYHSYDYRSISTSQEKKIRRSKKN